MSVSVSVTVTSTVGPFLPRSHRRSTTAVRSNKVSVGPTRLLTKLKQDCATPLPLLHHVADAMSSEMRAGLSSVDGPGLPMIPTYVHTLPSGYVCRMSYTNKYVISDDPLFLVCYFYYY